MKLLKKLIFMIILVVIAVSSFAIKQGYDLYTEAINQMSIEEKITRDKSAKKLYNL